MKVREVIKKLEEAGWYLARTKGDHRQFKNPCNPAKSLPKSTGPYFERSVGANELSGGDGPVDLGRLVLAPNVVTVPGNLSEDIPAGTLNNILKKAGLK